MSDKDGNWEEVEIKDFIWEHLCKSDNGRFDFAPLLFDVHREAPSGPELTKTVYKMEREGYVTDNRPNYGHFWVELESSEKDKCQEKV